ncbi:hypothetical protein SLS58_004235 [Diplodia intermedia]|uniref:Uncharacterized protein n=1 Tax=Diplodia intermedia TaxID=856260 RepID=A0ABR3TUZ1_9PEZI
MALVSDYGEFGENPNEESDHFHWKPQATVIESNVWVADNLYREKMEANNKIAKLGSLLQLIEDMFHDLMAEYQPDVPTVCRILQIYHSHVECARAEYKIKRMAPHDSLEPRIPAVGVNMLHSLPPIMPGRSNAGLVEEFLQEFEEGEMRAHYERELRVRRLLSKAPRIVELWRCARFSARFNAVADAETDNGDHDDDDNDENDMAALKAFVDKVEKAANAIAEGEGVDKVRAAGAEAIIFGQEDGVVIAEGEGEKKDEDDEGQIDSACAVAGSPAEEKKKKQLEGDEAVGWEAELVLLGGREAKTV